MRSKVDKLLSKNSGVWASLTSLLLIAIIGFFDHRMGNELSLSIFYLVPVGITSWYSGSRYGIATCVISGLMFFWIDRISGQDYIYYATPFWNASLRFSVFILVMYLITRLRQSLERFETLAEQDGLTGIMNARTFKQRYEWIASIAARYGRPTTLGYLDLDGFKGINDSLGHHVGDQVLKEVAKTIAIQIRASDLFGRLGGDEFAILLSETDLEGARTFFTEMRRKLINLATKNGWSVGFSFGVTVFQTYPASPEEAIKRADALMYKVKNAGKNDILFEVFNSKNPEG